VNEGTASHTARSVAAHRLDYDRLTAPYGDPDADEALARDVAGGMDPPKNRMHDYLRARTAFFDRVVVTALDRGVRQVVVGAAGYDGRALRYAKPGVRWFEIDLPATQADKRSRLLRLGVDTGHVTFIAADFASDPLADLLAAAGLDARRAALFLLEGVAVYLADATLDRVLEQFRLIAAGSSALAISVSTSAGGADRERFRERVAAVGEPARSTLTVDEASELLARAGWRVTDPGAPQQARRRAAGLLVARAASFHSPERSILTPPAPSPSAPADTRSGPPAPASAPGELPLSALLSHALVAYTIEFDNEAERLLPHRTQSYGVPAGAPRDAPWLTSLVMWANCLRYVPDEGITVARLRELARTGTNLDGMRRWGYVTLTSPAGEVAARVGRKSELPKIVPDTVLRPTEWGREAGRVWRGVDAVVAERWRERFGADAVAGLRDALAAVAGHLDPGLPDCLPILRFGLFSQVDSGCGDAGDTGDAADLPLWALLSRVLLAFAVDFERESAVSLAISANVLRVLSSEGVRARDVPDLAGVSKESVAMAMTALLAAGLVAEEPAPAGSRGKVIRLTRPGEAARVRYPVLVADIEARWHERFGTGTITALRQALEGVSGQLAEGLAPYPGNWRAAAPARPVLPDFPVVLHRGGYPDGS
jgi:methyltransferase (TIGR00027 family)